MKEYCDHGHEPAAKEAVAAKEPECCVSCPDAGCDGCACSAPANAGGGCLGGECGCHG